MNGSLAKRVAAAARATWMTVLLSWLFLMLAWAIALWLLHYRPSWARLLWGGGRVTWDTVQMMYLRAFAVMKVVVLVILAAAVWLSLWASRLKRLEGPGR